VAGLFQHKKWQFVYRIHIKLFIKLLSAMTKILSLFLLPSAFTVTGQTVIDVNQQLDLAMQQYEQMLAVHPDTNKTPHSLHADGQYKDMPTGWWCSGFFGGTLWYLFEYSKNTKWKDAAHLWTMAIQ